MDQVICRLPKVQQITGAKRSTIYAWVKDGTFPRPVRIGKRSVGWLEHEVQEWVSNRIEISRSIKLPLHAQNGEQHHVINII